MQIKPLWAENYRPMISTMQAKYRNIAYKLFSIVFWFSLWHFGARLLNGKLLFKIPLPIDTVKELLNCADDFLFWKAVGSSLIHIFSGFLIAVILGIVCGILSGNSLFFKELTSPIVRIIRSVPVAAVIILAWLWVPSNAIPSFIAFLMVFPIVWLQVETGLLSIDKKLIEMAQVMGMSNKDITRNIKIPSLLPSLRHSCIQGLGFAWKSGVAAEVICNPTGSIGALLSNAKSNLEYSKVFALVLTIIVLSLILENIIKFFWKEHRV